MQQKVETIINSEGISVRINELIEDLGMSRNKFALRIDTSSAMISKIINKNSNFGVELLQKIIVEFPNLNVAWLLTGVGDMWLNPGIKNSERVDMAVSNGVNNDRIIRKDNYEEIVDKNYVDNKAPLNLERLNMNKVENELRKSKTDQSKLYDSINTLLNFQYIIMNLDHYYFQDIDKKFYEINSNYNGKSFDYIKYRNDILGELDKLMAFKPALEDISKAILSFYAKVKDADSKNIVEGYLTGTPPEM